MSIKLNKAISTDLDKRHLTSIEYDSFKNILINIQGETDCISLINQTNNCLANLTKISDSIEAIDASKNTLYNESAESFKAAITELIDNIIYLMSSLHALEVTTPTLSAKSFDCYSITHTALYNCLTKFLQETKIMLQRFIIDIGQKYI